jgi:hypothetical protein
MTKRIKYDAVVESIRSALRRELLHDAEVVNKTGFNNDIDENTLGRYELAREILYLIKRELHEVEPVFDANELINAVKRNLSLNIPKDK